MYAGLKDLAAFLMPRAVFLAWCTLILLLKEMGHANFTISVIVRIRPIGPNFVFLKLATPPAWASAVSI